ncbi:DUF3016 domain-containing protein [Paraglaciecola sp. L3A3]|uniref:DUF3016 domain-containing protein n=1 Tax=Paraglaciecola sp. L3A3 TaxID=2686358 RepID=UPI00131C63FC|nr:DUF3016 domain-containing protein [Paraglaciecola sp. L3A3]
MMKLNFILLPALTWCFSQAAYGQENVEITWHNPEKYRDVRPSNGGKQKFMNLTFKRIDQYMLKLAKTLPKSQRLVITVSDLDLAGQVWPASFAGFGAGMTDIRVVKSVDIPRINFAYQLLSADGKIVKQAQVELKDLNFMASSNMPFSSDSLHFEKNMLKRWFKQEFPRIEQVANSSS